LPLFSFDYKCRDKKGTKQISRDKIGTKKHKINENNRKQKQAKIVIN
jgi:hypothetical protein